ncbi:hypothetical protein A2U01_0069596, partial [Trifolium medium]|nr:hypothetical protein [Trifolium medium]
YKESLRLQLVEPPKIPRLVGGKKFFESTKAFRGLKRVWCKHGGWWEVGTIINLKAMWRLLRISFELDVEKQKNWCWNCFWRATWFGVAQGAVG